MSQSGGRRKSTPKSKRVERLESESRTIRLATFNINNINRRLDVLIAWLEKTSPDIVCLQELKAAHEKFPEQALREAGYYSAWWGQKAWNGVAILCKAGPPIVTRYGLPGGEADRQSRYIEAAVQGIIVSSIYLPNGNPQPGPKFEYKLAWFERLLRHARKLRDSGVPVVIAGDYNVVPTDLDIYETRSWDNDALLQPESRAAFKRLLRQGWLDSLRHVNPADRIYTFWDYKRQRWPRDAGLRIDHVLLSPAMHGSLIDAGVDREVRGWVGASDHAPVWIKLSARDDIL